MANIFVTVEADGENTRYSVSESSTVGDVVNPEFRSDFNVSDRAETLVNGSLAGAGTPLQAGDVISFRVAASSKSVK